LDRLVDQLLVTLIVAILLITQFTITWDGVEVFNGSLFEVVLNFLQSRGKM